MDLKKLGQQAKSLVDKRGGSESVKEDADELKDIAKSQGSLADKAKAAVEAIKEPGAADEPAAPVATRRAPPSTSAPLRRSSARSAASTRATPPTAAATGGMGATAGGARVGAKTRRSDSPGSDAPVYSASSSAQSTAVASSNTSSCGAASRLTPSTLVAKPPSEPLKRPVRVVQCLKLSQLRLVESKLV